MRDRDLEQENRDALSPSPDQDANVLPSTVAGPRPNSAAGQALDRIAALPGLSAVLPQILPALSRTLNDIADPDRAAICLERLLHASHDPVRTLGTLSESPRTLEVLLTLFSGSHHLSEILLRQPESLGQLLEWRRLPRPSSAAALADEVRRSLSTATTEDEALASLRHLQDRHLLRIGVGDLLGLVDLPTVTSQLSALADSLVEGCLDVVRNATRTSEQEPRGADTAGSGLVVLALGKLGGRELNYSSDIDLVFLVRSDPGSYWQQCRSLVRGLSQMTPDGFLYRVDLRLRPWGRDGDLVNSIDSYVDYLRDHAKPSERQALLKARPVAGDLSLGRELLSRARDLVLSGSPDQAREDIRALKQRIEADLRRRGREWGEVKSGQGSIRDIEFVTQYLQLVHGSTDPRVLQTNTLDALTELYAASHLPVDHYRILAEGYVFLRTVEHYLQLMHYHQVHALPRDAGKRRPLAHRLRFRGPDAEARFTERYEQHSTAVREIYCEHLESAAGRRASSAGPVLSPIMANMPPSYDQTFSAAEIERHAKLAARLTEDNLAEVDVVPLSDDRFRVAIVGYDFLGELSVICGLLFIHGFNIVDGHVFTSGEVDGHRQDVSRGIGSPSQPWIVDVFTVRAPDILLDSEIWTQFARDLRSLLSRLSRGEQRQAQARLAKRIALALPPSQEPRALYPIDIVFDNDSSEIETVVRIEALDTLGFLYELTNALALDGVSIRRMTVDSAGKRIRDTLYVTDAHGRKILDAQRLQKLQIATVLTKHFTHLLPHSPNPENALLHFRELLGDLFRREDWATEMASVEPPEVLKNLALLLGESDFLWSDFLRMQYANLFPVLRDTRALEQHRGRDAMRRDLQSALVTGRDAKQTINAFKDREMFRIDMRQIVGHTGSFEQFSTELTDLAEVVFEAALDMVERQMRERYGEPTFVDGTPAVMSLCALGKFGGRELGFASDFELMLLYEGDGKTRHAERSVDSSEFYCRLIAAMNHLVVSRQEGIFEIDLRLRPYGSAGPAAVSLDAFDRYFGPEGDAWWYERQALVKLRPVAGDRDLGQRIVAHRDRLLYDDGVPDVSAARAMRERQVRHLITPGTINSKYSPGGLVDIEYLVQFLQIRHGHGRPELRATNTLAAISALAEAGLLDARDTHDLRDAYVYVRRLIDAQRIVRGHAKDLTVPSADGDELAFLARRLNTDPHELLDTLDRHLAKTRGLEKLLLGA